MHPFLLALLGGALIGLAASALLLFHGRVAGVSNMLSGLLTRPAADGAWRGAFVAGLVLTGAVALMVAPQAFDELPVRALGPTALAGICVGYGARLGNGCTSGHGICGLARRSSRSLVAVLTFIATAAVTVYIANHLLGGLQ